MAKRLPTPLPFPFAIPFAILHLDAPTEAEEVADPREVG